MTDNCKILVVDDDNAHRTMLRTLIGGWGYEINDADDGEAAIDKVKEKSYDLVLMDVRMVKISGLEALEKIKSYNPAIPIIIMTAYSSVETAVDALKKGAYDYLTKPLDFDKLRNTIERATEHTRLKEENRRLKESLGQHFDRRNIIGQSPAMTNLLETVAQVAPSEATVLISGDSGTGKELIAGAIHFNSHRKDGPFIKLNCAAITETLLESELFGHEKGAFTGAERRKEGRFFQAHGGSLFLDEVSEMSLTMQVKLLRVLQEREFTRVGGENTIQVDVRMLAATNKNLAESISKGKFREDLYYRLNVVGLEIPPLKKRREDIPLLAQHFLDVFAVRNHKKIKGFTPQAMDHLIRYDWPGNVRELMNAVERAVVLSQADFLSEKDFTFIDGSKVNRNGSVPDSVNAQIITDGVTPLEEVEKTTILNTLEASGGNKSEAARRLGITRKTLHKKLKAYGVMP
ncbi:MAG: sigma-54-dependent Fis family transcriptional regulator [Deltaproteobacteria bacterium]|nr:sigma-54-dependent Fis family transcriptional regulator [Deltaproteobacteria bacterium]